MELMKDLKESVDQARLGHTVKSWLKEGIPRFRWFRRWITICGWWAGRHAYDCPEPNGIAPTRKPYWFTRIEQKMKRLFAEITSEHPFAWQKLEGLRNHYLQRLKEIDGHINDLDCLTKDHEGKQVVLCMKPTVSIRQYLLWLLPISLGEFVFSAVSFAYSSVADNFAAELVLAAVMTLLILVLAHGFGRHLRSLPLAPDASRGERIRAVTIIVVLGTALAGLLGAITMIRYRGMTGQGANRWSALPLFLMGITLAIAAIYLAEQSEYSGCKCGTAALEKRRRRLIRLLFVVESWQQAVNDHKNKQQTQVQCLESELKLSYLQAYQFARHRRLDAERRKQRHVETVAPTVPAASSVASPARDAYFDFATPPGNDGAKEEENNRGVVPGAAPAKSNGRFAGTAATLVVGLILFSASTLLSGCNGSSIVGVRAMGHAQRGAGDVAKAAVATETVDACPTIEFLVDRSESMAQKRRSDLYQYVHDNVVPTLQPCARVIIETVVDQSTMADPEIVFEVPLPNISSFDLITTSLWQDPRKVKEDCVQRFPEEYASFTKAVSDVDSRLRILLDNPPKSNSTFLLDGVAEAAVKLSEETGPKILVILSDSMEDSRDHENFHWDFENQTFWEGNKVSELLAKLQNSGRIPNLVGVKVYFVGAGAKTPYLFVNATEFWNKFFTIAGVRDLHFGHWPRFQETRVQNLTVKERCKTVGSGTAVAVGTVY